MDHIWLNLGCSDDLKEDFINVDCRKFDDFERKCYVCETVDLSKPWPWPDNHVDFILANDIIEHLPDHVLTMNEMWRVLKPGAVAQIWVPTTEGRGAFQDPNHKSFWNRNSFFYYTRGIPERERFGNDYGVKAYFDVVKEETQSLVDSVIKLVIVLKAVK